VRCRDAARAEDQFQGLPILHGTDNAGREGRAGLGPGPLSIEAHLILAGFSRLQACDVDEGVVMVPDAEGWRGAAKHLDLAGSVGFDPDGRVRGTDVTQERTEDEVSHGTPGQATRWRAQ
jgi:hypothetical protein